MKLYFIIQEPYTNTATPWHSDEAYWLDLPDKRALTFWFPMQDVDVSVTPDSYLHSGTKFNKKSLG